MLRETRPVVMLSLLLFSLPFVGCVEQKVVGTSWGNYGNRADQKNDRSRSAASGEDTWAIALNRLEGPNHAQKAEQQRRQLAQATGMDIWTRNEGDRSLIYSGRYDSAQANQAQADLDRWRQMIATGAVRLPAVMLVPIVDTPQTGSNAQFDLRNARSRGVYTLQIGYYDEQFGPDFRKAAEQAAATLRQDGEEAWYYHGPYRSMVTIGTFGSDAVHIDHKTTGVTTYGPVVKALQKRFPNNLGNGLTIQEKRGETVNTQESFLVRIPQK